MCPCYLTLPPSNCREDGAVESNCGAVGRVRSLVKLEQQWCSIIRPSTWSLAIWVRNVSPVCLDVVTVWWYRSGSTWSVVEVGHSSYWTQDSMGYKCHVMDMDLQWSPQHSLDTGQLVQWPTAELNSINDVIVFNSPMTCIFIHA